MTGLETDIWYASGALTADIGQPESCSGLHAPDPKGRQVNEECMNGYMKSCKLTFLSLTAPRLNSTTLLTMMTDVMKTGKTKKTAHLQASVILLTDKATHSPGHSNLLTHVL